MYTKDYQLHIQAGLVDAGKDGFGQQEWIGTVEAWNKYEELHKNFINDLDAEDYDNYDQISQ